MKRSTWYIIAIAVLFVALMVMELGAPREFVWNPTFSHLDKQPFGSAIFDDMVSASMGGNYEVTSKTYYQLSQDSLRNFALLAVGNPLEITSVDTEAILKMVNRGNKVMLVSSSFGFSLADTLFLDTSYSFFNVKWFGRYMSRFQRDSIMWVPDTVFGERKYYAYSELFKAYFTEHDSLATELAYVNPFDSLSYPVALKHKIGKGELYTVSTPLMFTNYGMLDRDNSQYIFRLLSHLQGMPLLRTEAYTPPVGESQSPLRYFLSQPPLRWGLYTTLIVLLLFMLYTAKRRQRVIPVVKEPENRSVEFVEMIGTLYYQRKDHADLLRKKYLYFADTLRRTIQVDPDDGSDEMELSRRIAAKTGMDERIILYVLNGVRPVLRNEKIQISEELMTKYIDKMNEIITHI